MKPLTKHIHRSYSETQKRNVLQFHKDMEGKLPLTASAYEGIPPSTIRTWIKQEQARKSLRINSIISTVCIIPLLIVGGLLGVMGIALGVTYILDGPEEARFMWEAFRQLLTFRG